MAQHDYDIANDTAANVRADINDVLAAIVSNNSGASAPPTTYANQWWYDSTNDILKIRNEVDTDWIDFATVNQTDGQVEFVTLYSTNISDGTTSVGTEYVVNGSAKAWAYITSSSGTPVLTNSYNVSSVDDDGIGLYGCNFTNAMADANLCIVAAGDPRGSAANVSMGDYSRTTSAVDIALEASGGAGADRDANALIWGDLA